jgi:micrococcal nuclease
MAAPTGGAAASACRITNVVDGDTVDMRCAGTGGFRARLTGYDTPESFEPRCSAEARAARAATERLRVLVSTARTVEPRFGGVDRYGRQLVRLSLDGRDVGAILIAEGLAVRYSGGRRIDWCARLT